MVAAIIALSFLGGLLHDGDVKVERGRVGPWRVEIKQDRFTGKEHCMASQQAMLFDRGVVTFSFSHNTDTANAVFRVDRGDLRTAGSVGIEAAGLGAGFETRNFDNPSNGEVHIPLRVLGNGNVIEIKPNDKASPRRFRLGGLTAAVDFMRSRGCIVG